METEYSSHRLLWMSKKRASWLSTWRNDKVGRPKDFGQGDAARTGKARLCSDRTRLGETLPWTASCLWIPEGKDRKSSRVAIRGYTDNKSNEALLKKAMTTKYPSMLVLMETAEELSHKKNCELQLQWIRRDINQLADDLTNEEFKEFDPDLRIVQVEDAGPATRACR